MASVDLLPEKVSYDRVRASENDVSTLQRRQNSFRVIADKYFLSLGHVFNKPFLSSIVGIRRPGAVSIARKPV